MECPKCNSEIGSSRYCGCGWKKTSKEGRASNFDQEVGYVRCEWLSNGERCRYPGTISRNTNGSGPFYCLGHDGCSDPLMGSAIVEHSHTYRHMPMKQRDAIHVARLKDSDYKPKVRVCEERGCLKPGTLQSNGRYLCYMHKSTPDAIEYAKQKKGNVAERIVMREPGDDFSELDQSLGSQA